MQFKVISILKKVKELYEIPLSTKRFEQYLKMLQGSNIGDIELPIGGFNPMAQPHILKKLKELEALNIEDIMQETLNKVVFPTQNKGSILVGFNLADDLKGGWTNRTTTDFDSKFKINALVERRFCVPFFWSNEGYSIELIEKRTLEYLYRTLFQLENGRPKNLDNHLQQEFFVARNTYSSPVDLTNHSIPFLTDFYKKNKTSEDYSLIFNFFYGDKASQFLNYPTYGINDFTGFDYARCQVE